MIQTERGDIWSYLPTHHIVIPTNIGWRANGTNVMGRGLAKQAAERWPDLAGWYGRLCRKMKTETTVALYSSARLILFPVKPLNELAPQLSWKYPADLKLIERSARHLSFLADLGADVRVALPLVGCGNGRLDMAEVRPILDRWLSDDRFVLVLPQHDRVGTS